MGQSQNKAHSPRNKYKDFGPVDHVKQQQAIHVPTMFRWVYGGRKVYIIGTFNQWTQKIPMNYNSEENSFIVILNVPIGRHEYRFIVDDEEKPDPHSPVSPTNDKNNVIEIQPVSPHNHVGDDLTTSESARSDDESSEHSAIMDDSLTSGSPSRSAGKGGNYLHHHVIQQQQQQQQQQQHQKQHKSRAVRRRADSSGSPHSPSNYHPSTSSPLTQHHHTTPQTRQNQQAPSRQYSEETQEPTKDGYGQTEMVFVENKKAPPLLPPHLRFTPLNSSVKMGYDPSILPVPLHVTVNHVYFASQGNVSMIGISQRYRDKFATIVMYRPRITSNSVDGSDEYGNPVHVA